MVKFFPLNIYSCLLIARGELMKMKYFLNNKNIFVELKVAPEKLNSLRPFYWSHKEVILWFQIEMQWS
jgi:hypothetical protein